MYSTQYGSPSRERCKYSNNHRLEDHQDESRKKEKKNMEEKLIGCHRDFHVEKILKGKDD